MADNTTSTNAAATQVQVESVPAPTHQVDEGHHGAPEAPATQPEPQILNGIKVYPPSYIPAKAVLHLPKKSLIAMELEHIEGIHIAIFLGLTVFLFIGMWKRPGFRN